MKGQIEKSHKRYMEYDPNVWVGEYFDDKTGGYVVVNRKRKVNAIKINVPAGRRHFTTSLRDEGWYEAPEALQVPVR